MAVIIEIFIFELIYFRRQDEILFLILDQSLLNKPLFYPAKKFILNC